MYESCLLSEKELEIDPESGDFECVAGAAGGKRQGAAPDQDSDDDSESAAGAHASPVHSLSQPYIQPR